MFEQSRVWHVNLFQVTKPYIIGVKEQRLSALLVSVFVGLSAILVPLLRLVLISVLFGLFLYTNISSTNGIQFL
jgi:solute carrier family 4 anion exchanger 2